MDRGGDQLLAGSALASISTGASEVATVAIVCFTSRIAGDVPTSSRSASVRPSWVRSDRTSRWSRRRSMSWPIRWRSSSSFGGLIR